MAELRGTDFWSEGGATGLHWLKYEMGAAAIRKINIESAGLLSPLQPGVLRADQREPADRARSRGA